jgi:hypothetical protein
MPVPSYSCLSVLDRNIRSRHGRLALGTLSRVFTVALVEEVVVEVETLIIIVALVEEVVVEVETLTIIVVPEAALYTWVAIW